MADALQRLEAAGFTGKGEARLRDIGQANGLEHPFELLEVIRAK